MLPACFVVTDHRSAIPTHVDGLIIKPMRLVARERAVRVVEIIVRCLKDRAENVFAIGQGLLLPALLLKSRMNATSDICGTYGFILFENISKGYPPSPQAMDDVGLLKLVFWQLIRLELWPNASRSLCGRRGVCRSVIASSHKKTKQSHGETRFQGHDLLLQESLTSQPKGINSEDLH